MPTLRRKKQTASTNSGGWASKTGNGYRSGLEERIAQELIEKGVEFEYETLRIDYLRPAKRLGTLQILYYPMVLLLRPRVAS